MLKSLFLSTLMALTFIIPDAFSKTTIGSRTMSWTSRDFKLISLELDEQGKVKFHAEPRSKYDFVEVIPANFDKQFVEILDIKTEYGLVVLLINEYKEAYYLSFLTTHLPNRDRGFLSRFLENAQTTISLSKFADIHPGYNVYAPGFWPNHNYDFIPLEFYTEVWAKTMTLSCNDLLQGKQIQP